MGIYSLNNFLEETLQVSDLATVKLADIFCLFVFNCSMFCQFLATLHGLYVQFLVFVKRIKDHTCISVRLFLHQIN